AMWLSTKVFGGEKVEKDDPRVLKLKEWVDEQYASGRVTVLSNQELMDAVRQLHII
ncbi:MAG TPA: 2-isopropylmalate synthase, partial [Clostridiales bacterium]|nr:2-isopropylmalate synthase [Clostridiales bacterium]